MSAAFTPAPWSIPDRLPFMIVQDFGNYMVRNIAVVNRRKGGRIRDDAEAHANARLIAAAPELYEAVRLFVEKYDQEADDGVTMMLAYNEALEAGIVALRKARGEQ